MGLFDDFGFGDDFFSAGENAKKKEKAAEKKEPAKKPAAKKKASGNDFEVTLPVTVKGRNLSVEITGEGTRKVSGIVEELVSTYSYRQFLAQGFRFFYIPAVSTLYVDSSFLKAASSTAAVYAGDGEEEEEEVKFHVTVCDGGIQMEVTETDFDKDPAEVTVQDVLDRWLEVNPSYSGCRLFYQPDAGIMYPVFKVAEGSISEDVLEVNVFGEIRQIEVTEETKSYESLAKSLTGSLGGGCSRIVVCGSTYWLAVTSGSEKTYGGVAASAVVKEVEKKYKLPFRFHFVNSNRTYELDSSMFAGKEKVTENEVRRYIGTVVAELADEKRKLFYIYDDDRNILNGSIVSGKLG